MQAATALHSVGEVFVVAPDRNQSGIGTATTLHNPIRATKVSPILKGVTSYAVEGTPADSVILALDHLVDSPVDLVVAGINHGANLGEDVLLSGTVGAALQGYFRNIPSIAISVASLTDLEFGPAVKLLRALATNIKAWAEAAPIQHVALDGKLNKYVPLLNINLPNLPMDQVKGITLTHLARRAYKDSLNVDQSASSKQYWIRRNVPNTEWSPDSDSHAINNGEVSITPLTTDLTDALSFQYCNPLCQTLEQSLFKGA